ncbi:MAG: hypothetical protein Q7U04_10160 [Bacteriovorax sp.]|nr:hypothetical protein [Bacteriovorax sp.]
MKKIMMIGSALIVLSSSAFASQARLLALGMNETDNEGMYYISDSRNIFLNVANINLYPNQAEFDWGSTGQDASITGTPSPSNSTLISSTSPKAQGGAFKKYGEYVFGLYYGNESNTSSLLRVAGTSAASSLNFSGATPSSKMLQTADNQIDVFFGGDNGTKWAVNGLYSAGKDESRNSKDSAYTVRGGLIGANWDTHLNLSLGSKSSSNETINHAALGLGTTTVAQEFKGKFGVHAGGSYLLDEKNRIFGYVKHYGWEQSDSYNNYAALKAAGAGTFGTFSGQNGTIKGDFTSYYLGWGRDFDVNNGDKLFASLAAKKTEINLNYTTKTEVRTLVIPLVLGYEAKATDWLTLRGSVVQNIYGTKDNKKEENLNPVAKSLIALNYGANGKSTIANSTAVNAGATLVFDQLSIDGLIGAVGPTGTNGSKKGILSASNLETSVGLTYKY